VNLYEMGVVIRADLEEEVFRAEMERVRGFIDRFGGIIEKVDEWGRRKLAYPILKLNEGMYTFITYKSESSTPKEVESRLRLMENVLRFLTVRIDESDLAAAQKFEDGTAEAPAAEEVKTEEKAPETSEQTAAEAVEE